MDLHRWISRVPNRRHRNNNLITQAERRQMRICSHYSSCEVQPDVVYADRHCRLPLSVVNNLLLGDPSSHFEEMKCYLQLRLPNFTTHCFFIHQGEHITRVATSHCRLTQNVDRALLCLDNSQLQSIRDGAFPKPQLCALEKSC